MSFLPLLALVALIGGIDDGPQAATRMKAMLTAFGERGPFRMQRLSEQNWAGTPRWNVKLSGPGGTTYEGWFGGPNGEITLWRGQEQNLHSGFGATRLPPPGEERRIRGYLSKIGVREHVRLISFASDNKGTSRAYLAILRNGYPFVSYPRYGYNLTFATVNHRFISLRALQQPPQVDGIPPKLDETAALAALKRTWDSQVAKPAVRDRHWKRVWYTLTGKPELGYFLQKGHTKAHLVWKISYMSYRDVTYAIQGGSDGMLIDAVNGDRVPTETVP